MKTISVFGLGYVGCVTAACFANSGFNVIGVDVNEDKVNMLNQGKSPIVEPGLEKLLSDMVAKGRLRATQSCEDAISNSDMAFICVGTPGNEFGQLQLSALRRVSQEIGAALKTDSRRYTVVVRSTVLPGTTVKTVCGPLYKEAGAYARSRIKVAVNPEFMREGTALKDFANPPYTLIGCEDDATTTLLRKLYDGVDAPFVVTQIATAETVKYVSNTYHALKVCFANEIGDACDRLGVDGQEVMRIFRMDTKLNVSAAYLRPGFAFGGSCLPKDVKALLYAAHHLNVDMPVLNAIIPSNNGQIERAINSIVAAGAKRIGVVGLSFKADTDDLRESPMVRVVESLIGKGLTIRIVDTNVSIARLTGANRRYIEEEIPHISMLMCDSPEALIEHADVLVIGSDSADAVRVLALAKPTQTVIDLTRGWLRIKVDGSTQTATAKNRQAA
ncbi:MAG: nucleotide sugar dehydrogenase [Gammaproteobacteria bacterium]|nr:nucleotide sugar dehydrogenase [Gammaproteobacteria bacterium]